MLIDYVLGQTSIVFRVKIRSSTTGNGLKALTGSSSGLIIGTIADNEATSTAYTAAGSTIQTIATLGTYVAPSASDCRFAEVDATNHPGLYEVQLANARFAVSSAKSLTVSITGASSALDCDVVIPLRSVNPYDAVRGGMSALPNAAAAASGGLPTVGTGSGQINPTAGGVDVQTWLTHAVTVDSNNLPIVDVGDWLGHAVTVDSNNAPNVSVKYFAGTAVTGRDIGASVLLSPGTGTGQLSITAGLAAVNTTQFLGHAVILDANNYPGVNIVDVAGQAASYYSGVAQAGSSSTITLASTASTTDNAYRYWRVQRLDTEEWAIITGYVGSTNVATIRGAWAGAAPTSSTQYVLDPPVSADLELILGTASAGAAGYVGLDWSHVNAPTTTVVLSGTTVGTLTTYTGNTPQTGDSYARIGATGSGLSSLATHADATSLSAQIGSPTQVGSPVTLSLSQPLGTPRAVDSIADGSIQINDALWAAIGAGVGKADASDGTHEVISTPSTGTALRTFTLTAVAGTPSSYITKRS